MVDLVDINNKNPATTKNIIKFLSGNIFLTPNLKEDPRKTPRHEMGTVRNVKNKNNILASLKIQAYVQ